MSYGIPWRHRLALVGCSLPFAIGLTYLAGLPTLSPYMLAPFVLFLAGRI